MFVILLKFSTNKAAASEHMAAHNEWIASGVADGTFHCVGSIKPQGGGAILAVGDSLEKMQARVDTDPFVQHDVVTAEIIDVDVKKTSPAAQVLAA